LFFGLAYPLVLTIAILCRADKLVGQRVDPDEQALALDTAGYREMGYMLDFARTLSKPAHLWKP
jgi:hypothetical protein